MAENIEQGGHGGDQGHGGHGGHGAEHGHGDHGHHINYKKIYLVLLVLLVISVAGPFLGIFWVTLLTAFGIAIVKATLVVQNFMHLKIERQIAKWVLAASLLLLFLFFAGVAPDVMKHDGAGWENLAAKAVVDAGIDSGEEHGEEGEEHDEEAEPEPEPVVAFAPDQAYSQICSTCHGAGGRGDGAGAAALDPKPADFTLAEFWETRTDADLVKVIREGGASVGKSAQMAPWGALYDEEQAQQIVDYIRNTFVQGG